ncbi:hypothetical protein OPV22_027655 [Ensete ventricosum]|uniref:Phytocyanin domain-containing protein n=1 Tax=Ensete ventricosum TaxID=4639 RepID=A0AAV8Q4A5_ENSVE|nr:hypothetical protein OPV22_027655 [Ensete ventricosum]
MRAKRWPIQLQLAVVATACIGCSLAHQHLVGDSIWSIPPSNEFYSDWASNRSFAVGDDLVFRFELGFYDVVQVSRREFDSCSADNAFRSFLVGPATVSLNEEASATTDRCFSLFNSSGVATSQVTSTTVESDLMNCTCRAHVSFCLFGFLEFDAVEEHKSKRNLCVLCVAPTWKWMMNEYI